MKLFSSPVCIPVLLLFTIACSTNDRNQAKDTEDILALIRQERKAHFEKNASLFMSEFSDSMVSVNRGEVRTATMEERRKRIQGYFDSVEFIKWDDVKEPQIRFSDDGSLAYAIIQKQVIVSRTDSLSKKSVDTTDFAWVSIYRHGKDGWKVECNVSTNK
ncbi:MAG TPA: hypothetical protein VD993_07085 [Chitinophagaceae bacterium]|nr:hypothetical protein [Chitinophagaceae bacterium]